MTPEEITGAFVLKQRKAAKLSRERFSEMLTKANGGEPFTPTRLRNLELKESFKPGNREVLARVLVELGGGTPANGAQTGRTEDADARPAALHIVIAPDFHDDDDDDEAVEVRAVSPAAVQIFIEPEDDEDSDVAVQFSSERRISNSEMQTFKRCRRKWWLSWYRGLRPQRPAPTGPRAIGDRVHRALATYYVPEDQHPVDPRDALELLIVEDWTELVGSLNGGDPDESVVAEFNSEVVLQRAMIEGYVEWLAETGVDQGLRIIGSEQYLETPLETAAGRVLMIGKLDVRAQRERDTAPLFIDHKTVGDLTQPTRTLHLDEQMLHYHLLEWLTTPEGETRCDGALYNMLRKVKRSARARPPFFGRHEVRHSDIELASYRKRLEGHVITMMGVERTLELGADPLTVVYPTPTKECAWDCDFFAICPMFDDGSRVEDAIAGIYTTGSPLSYYTRDVPSIEDE